MTFRADYPGAIVVEAKNYGYIVNNNPKGFVYHTPEEDADDDPQTPGYLAGTTRNASYTYFVSFLGFVFQLVPERHGAYANAVVAKPYPSWANPTLPPPADNLNLQCISISFEGHAATIHRTMVRGGSQWNAGVALVAHRAKRLRINPDNWARHADVSIARSDPGSLDLVTFTLDVKAKMEDSMPLDNETKDYFAGLMRGVVLALGTGQMNGAMRRGDPDWTPPKDLLDVLNAIAGIQAGSGLTEEETVEAVKKAGREGTD